MKKIMIAFATALVLTACGTSNTPATTTADSTKTTVDSTKVAVDSTTNTIGGGSGAGTKVEQPQK
jgi:ABC-type glycerol-3-phosphate transport system substrate-binding protein